MTDHISDGILTFRIGERDGRSVPRIWSNIGYDEINWTVTARGRDLLQRVKDSWPDNRFTVRNHNAFTSGNALSSPAWGSGNVCHRESDGTLRFDWHVIDEIYDTIVANGGLPFIELGFMPYALARDFDHRDPGSDWQGGYEREGSRHPAAHLDEWGALVEAFITHLVGRYGADEVGQWFFELWNEPDLQMYWAGTVQDYLQMWDVTADAARRAFPSVTIGGPGTTNNGPGFLESFCEHVSEPGGRLPDFVSFHVKGGNYFPHRTYDQPGGDARLAPDLPQMLRDIDRSLEIISKHSDVVGLPVYITECDAVAGTVFGVWDNPNYVHVNSEHYPAFVADITHRMLDRPTITGFTHWAFYMEAKRWFEGNRALVDNDNVPRPILPGLALLDRLSGGERLSVDGPEGPIAVTVVTQPGKMLALVSHYRDPWWETGTATIALELPGEPGDFTEYAISRVDPTHANSFRVWESFGSPQLPSAEQISALHDAAQLSQEVHSIGDDGVVQIEIPLHGIALLEFRQTSR